jgi:hypothetical protein
MDSHTYRKPDLHITAVDLDPDADSITVHYSLTYSDRDGNRITDNYTYALPYTSSHGNAGGGGRQKLLSSNYRH